MGKKLKQNKDLTKIIGLTLLFFFGMLLLEQSFIGMYMIDFEQESCSEDKQCLAEEVCCHFYNENSGICEKESNCKAIEQITKEEKEKISSDINLEDYKFTEEEKEKMITTVTSHLEKPKPYDNFPSIISGSILIILGIIWMIYIKKGKEK